MDQTKETRERQSSTVLTRTACTALQPYVDTFWTTDARTTTCNSGQLEAVLPTGRAHIVIRLNSSLTRILCKPSDRNGLSTKASIFAGVRSVPYYKNVGGIVAPSVGIQLRPGSLEPISGTPAGILSGKHFELESIWGKPILDALLSQLNIARSPSQRLDIVEIFLLKKLTQRHKTHAAIQEALHQMTPFTKIEDMILRSGLSHRHFISLFSEILGLTPKRYQRLVRFNHALSLTRLDENLGWAAIAAESGFTDQSHLNRDFATMAGLTPTQYRKHSASSMHHLTLSDPADRIRRPQGQIYPRQNNMTSTTM